ncbi:MAG: PEP-CTERM sorting domain-containing protein [Hydrogenophaga sp.]
MKLKLIAAAAALALSGAANAAIDNGAGGNGELFFTAWDGANSYTFDLNTTIDAFQSSVAAAGTGTYVNATLDALFTSFISTANLASLTWNIVAAESLGPRRLLDTYTTLPATRITADLVRSTITGVQSFVGAVNTGITAQGNGNSAVFAAGTPGYANNATGVRFGTNNGGGLNFNNSGTVANNSYANGLGFLRIDAGASGVAASTYTPYVDEGFAVRAYFDSAAGKVVIAAVPEPETYAMLLAGLGLMGAIARPRRKQG